MEMITIVWITSMFIIGAAIYDDNRVIYNEDNCLKSGKCFTSGIVNNKSCFNSINFNINSNFFNTWNMKKVNKHFERNIQKPAPAPAQFRQHFAH